MKQSFHGRTLATIAAISPLVRAEKNVVFVVRHFRNITSSQAQGKALLTGCCYQNMLS